MTLRSKPIIIGVAEAALLLPLPFLLLHFAQPHEAMGLLMLLFFIVNPAAAVCLGALAGWDIKRLWWGPPSFPPLFFVGYCTVLCEIVWDLLFYAVIYLVLGVLSAVVSCIAKRILRGR